MYRSIYIKVLDLSSFVQIKCYCIEYIGLGDVRNCKWVMCDLNRLNLFLRSRWKQKIIHRFKL